MKSNEIRFKTVLSSLRKGEKPCYRAVVNHNGTVYLDEIARNAAARVGMDEAVMRFNAELFFAQVAEEMKGGNRVEVENLFSGGILDSATAVNVTEGNHAILKRVLDTVSKVDGVITNQPNVTVYLSGTSLLLNAAASDEGVWLEDKEGTVVAKATIVGSTSTTVDCTFATLPEDGEYKIVVATRGGLGPEFGVSLARKVVEVKTAN